MHTRLCPFLVALARCTSLKTLLLGIVGTLVFSTVAFARDSAWLLGDNGKVAVNIFEHRAGMGRATGVTLIYGSFFLHGELHDTNSGKITLVLSDPQPANRYTFTGTISIDYEKSQLTLKGAMTDGTADHTEIEKLNSTIKCKPLGD